MHEPTVGVRRPPVPRPHGSGRAGRNRDIDALKELLRDRQPAAIVLGTRNLELRRLEQEIRRIAAEVVQENASRLPIDVTFIDDDVARFYMASDQ